MSVIPQISILSKRRLSWTLIYGKMRVLVACLAVDDRHQLISKLAAPCPLVCLVWLAYWAGLCLGRQAAGKRAGSLARIQICQNVQPRCDGKRMIEFDHLWRAGYQWELLTNLVKA